MILSVLGPDQPSMDDVQQRSTTIPGQHRPSNTYFWPKSHTDPGLSWTQLSAHHLSFVCVGGQAHGLGKNHKHWTKSGFQVNLRNQIDACQNHQYNIRVEEDPHFHSFTLSYNNSFTFHAFTLSHDYCRVEEGQEPVNLTGGPLAYKYQFQEMFFHWGEKVVIMMVTMMLLLLLMMMMVIMMEMVRTIRMIIVCIIYIIFTKIIILILNHHTLDDCSEHAVSHHHQS